PRVGRRGKRQQAPDAGSKEAGDLVAALVGGKGSGVVESHGGTPRGCSPQRPTPGVRSAVWQGQEGEILPLSANNGIEGRNDDRSANEPGVLTSGYSRAGDAESLFERRLGSERDSPCLTRT